ncbi:MAG: phosphoenolpyruvate synthase [Pseudonocardia sp.]|nr:phosphoenolpyruvate synthase [Pseudonocardia sp.]
MDPDGCTAVLLGALRPAGSRMPCMRFIRRFDELGRDDVDVAGGKGANLGELTRAGFPVPPGFVLTTDAYRAVVEASGIGPTILELATGSDLDTASAAIRALFGSVRFPDAMARELRASRKALGEGPVAVRSSATAEDLEGASFAGQQDTYLDVGNGRGELLGAVRRCWASLWTERAMAYRARQGIGPADVALAVVVQEMVDADAAGVLFTANPATGRRDEAVISAAWGLGESVVSGSVTTDDTVADKKTGRVRSRTTADKAVMTVPTGRGTEERPVPAGLRSEPVLSDDQVATLTALGTRIEDHFGGPQDIEWARSGTAFRIVQSRPVTALPEPEAAPPTDWPVPDPKAIYVRASIVEQLPDPLTPLFEELIDGSVTRSLQALMTELLDAGVVRDGDVGLPTVNGYAYYRYSRAGMARIMLRSPAALPVLAGSNGEARAQVRWRERSRPRYAEVLRRWTDRPLDELTTDELMAGVGELLDAGTEYYTAVQTIIPIAASSEVVFTWFYEHLVRRPGDPPAVAFLLGFDSAPIRAEKSLYDLAAWARTTPDLTGALLAGQSTERWPEWDVRLRAHLDAHGHTLYNMDFANAVPADDPAPLLGTVRFYLGGGGADPHERQRASADRREAATEQVLARLDPLRRRTFRQLLRWAQKIAPVREDALADMGLAWPQLRRMLRELGRRLVEEKVIDDPDDVFWLRRDEVLQGRPGAVEQRKELWRGRRRVTPPQVLPRGSYWERFDAVLPASSAEQTGNVLRGTGASAGRVVATARVLAGPQDFGRMRPGDALVASIATPAWTSLFAMAAAVVTDIGGPLSHSSIVAREYGIPAVLGTGAATRRISDGARIRVDGDAGTVTLVDEPDEPDEPAAATERRSRTALVAAGGGIAALGLGWWLRRHR